MMLTSFGTALVAFLWDLAKIAIAVGAARVAYVIYAYKKKWIINSH